MTAAASLPLLFIVWPYSTEQPWTVRLVDESDRNLAPVCLSVQVRVEPTGAITADLDLLINEHDQPMADNGPTLLTDDGQGYRHRVFSYVVSGMMVLDKDPDS